MAKAITCDFCSANVNELTRKPTKAQLALLERLTGKKDPDICGKCMLAVEGLENNYNRLTGKKDGEVPARSTRKKTTDAATTPPAVTTTTPAQTPTTTTAHKPAETVKLPAPGVKSNPSSAGTANTAA